jgi:hypothetical protein
VSIDAEHQPPARKETQCRTGFLLRHFTLNGFQDRRHVPCLVTELEETPLVALQSREKTPCAGTGVDNEQAPLSACGNQVRAPVNPPPPGGDLPHLREWFARSFCSAESGVKMKRDPFDRAAC